MLRWGLCQRSDYISMDFKAFIFDFDGTLVESEHVNIAAARQAFESFGYRLLENDHSYVVGRSSADYIPILAEKYGIPVELAETIRKNQREAYQGLWDEIATIMPDAKNTLEILKSRNKMLSLATTNRIHTVEKFINAFDLHGFFSLILTQEDVTHRKPHPEVYLLAKQRIALSEEEILVVEDSEVGVAAAKAAGLYCAAVPNQHTRSHDFSRADYVCGSLKEILKLV